MSDFFVGVTDNAWFKFLSERSASDVNFWRPSSTSFRALQHGGMFLFKLHAPLNFIVGGGFFVNATQLTVRQAWDWFGTANGCPSLEAFVSKLGALGKGPAGPSRTITCILLGEAFYFPRHHWIPIPSSFRRHTQVGKGYQISEAPDLFAAVVRRLEAMEPLASPATDNVLVRSRHGRPHLVIPRLGQGLFRGVVAEAYGRRCAVTGERALPALEAAHIVPYSEGGDHALENGLLLRSDVHRLFDAGYVTVEPDERVLVVSRRLRTEFHNGHEYLRLHGMPVAGPAPGYPAPSHANLLFHAEHVFVA